MSVATPDRRPVIVLDFDGVLCLSNAVKSEWIRANLGRDIPPEQCDRAECSALISVADYERAKAEAYERDGTLRAPAVAGAIDGVRALAARARLVLLTARPAARMGYAREWLARQGIADCFVEWRSCTDDGRAKIEIAHALGAVAMVDDDTSQLHAPLGALVGFHFGRDATTTDATPVRDWHAPRPALLELINHAAPTGATLRPRDVSGSFSPEPASP